MSTPETGRKGLGLSAKVVLTTFSILVVVVAINYVMFLRGYAKDAKSAMMEKAAAFTAVADDAKNYASEQLALGAVDQESLLAEAVSEVKKGGDYQDTRFFGIIPVVTGWKTAEEAAKRESIDFRISSFEARNPANEPAPGNFRATLLADLTKQVERGGAETLGRIDPKTNTLHDMRAIRLGDSCMACHGDTATFDAKDSEGKYDGRDALGFKMENWNVGYMHGAYEVAMPLGPMDAQVGGFFKNGLMVTVPVMIVTGAGFIVLLRRLLSRPLVNLGERIKKIEEVAKSIRGIQADTNTAVARIKSGSARVSRGVDLVTSAGTALSEIVGSSRSVLSMVEGIAASADQQFAASEQIARAVEQISAGTRESNQGASQAAQAAANLSQQAEALQRLVGRFKI